MCRSKRPGRSRAGSSTSGRLVAAMTITDSVCVKPSISLRIWLSVCSRSSCPPPSPAPRCRPTASISSMKRMRRGVFLGGGEHVADAAGPHAHEHLDELRAADGEERARPPRRPPPGPAASCRCPAGPSGGCPWARGRRAAGTSPGFLRNSTTSSNSCLTPSRPATSSKVTGLSPDSYRRAGLLLNPARIPPPRNWSRVRRNMNQNAPEHQQRHHHVGPDDPAAVVPGLGDPVVRAHGLAELIVKAWVVKDRGKGHGDELVLVALDVPLLVCGPIGDWRRGLELAVDLQPLDLDRGDVARLAVQLLAEQTKRNLRPVPRVVPRQKDGGERRQDHEDEDRRGAEPGPGGWLGR